jgi:hypothetical protein
MSLSLVRPFKVRSYTGQGSTLNPKIKIGYEIYLKTYAQKVANLIPQ